MANLGRLESSAAVTPSGRSAKALSTGAKTVKGPGPSRISRRPALWTAAVNVVKRPLSRAASTMSFVGFMTGI